MGSEVIFMVSPQQNYPGATTPVSGIDDRGIRDRTVVSTESSALAAGQLPFRHNYFWGAVVSGALVAMAITILSSALMFGCRVGVYNNTGEVSLGVGSAIWMAVTACIAYFVGGMIASMISNPGDTGWIRGLTVWALGITLTIILTSMAAQGAVQAYGPNTVQTTANVATHNYFSTVFRIGTGEAWTVFITLLCGLVFGMLGGKSTGHADVIERLDR